MYMPESTCVPHVCSSPQKREEAGVTLGTKPWSSARTVIICPAPPHLNQVLSHFSTLGVITMLTA